MANIYIDMDGTLAKWQNKTLEEVATKGYFRELPAVDSVVTMAKKLIASKMFNIYILSSVLNDNHSADDKRYWLKSNLPEMKDENIFFVPYGENKADYVNLDKNSYLIDDLSRNLHEWEAAGGKEMKDYIVKNNVKLLPSKEALRENASDGQYMLLLDSNMQTFISNMMNSFVPYISDLFDDVYVAELQTKINVEV